MIEFHIIVLGSSKELNMKKKNTSEIIIRYDDGDIKVIENGEKQGQICTWKKLKAKLEETKVELRLKKERGLRRRWPWHR